MSRIPSRLVPEDMILSKGIRLAEGLGHGHESTYYAVIPDAVAVDNPNREVGKER